MSFKKGHKINLSHGHYGKRDGAKRSPTYNSWRSMKYRCFNPKSISFPSYGAVGITVCKRWLKFENFLADMGERPEEMTLDRINPNGNYEPNNCRWADIYTQNHNRIFKKKVA